MPQHPLSISTISGLNGASVGPGSALSLLASLVHFNLTTSRPHDKVPVPCVIAAENKAQ